MTEKQLNAISDVNEMISILKMAGWEMKYAPEAGPHCWHVWNPDKTDYEVGSNLLDAWGDAWAQYVESVTGDKHGH